MRRSMLRRTVPLLLLGALLCAPRSAYAQDDFAFGQALAAQGRITGDPGYFEYARKVYEAVLASPNASEVDKDLCRYGIAELAREQAVAATLRQEIPYATVRDLFRGAVKEMDRFVEKNPKHKQAVLARLNVGTTRLAFVQWARDRLLPDAEELAARKASAPDVVADATDMVNAAITHFEKWMAEGGENAAVAEFYMVMSQYYRALVFPAGSQQAREALARAGQALENFILLNEGTLLSAHAQDYSGLVFWERAKAARTEEEKEDLYRNAVTWFETCIEVPVESVEELQVVANGYYHMGQMCAEAGRVGATNFYRVGLGYLGPMLERHPGVVSVDNGLRAVYELARLEAALERNDRAVELTKTAIGHARKQGKQWLVNIGNRMLRGFVGVGGVMGAGDPAVLKGVADNLFLEEKYADAIRAYQYAIAAVPRRTLETFEGLLLPCWLRLSAAYEKQGDLLAAALALEPIHDAWMDGLIPRKGGPEDPKLIEYGDHRGRAIRLWKELGTALDSPTYLQRAKDMERALLTEYPGHPITTIGEWNAAIEAFEEARKLKQANNAAWKAKVAEARRNFERVARQAEHIKQDDAWHYLVRLKHMEEDWTGLIETARAAITYWESPESVAQQERHPTIRARRTAQRGFVEYWMAEAHLNLGERDASHYDKVLAISEDWRTTYEMLKDASNGLFYNGILSLRVLALLAKGDLEAADRPYRRLLKDDPSYWRLQVITFKLAEHYNKQQAEIHKQLNERVVKLRGTPDAPGAGVRARLRELDEAYTRTLIHASDQQSGLDKARELIRAWEESRAKGVLATGIDEKMYQEALQKVAQLEKELPEVQVRLNEMSTRKEALERELDQLTRETRELSQQLYEPLVTAAAYYTDYTNALSEAGLPLDRENVRIFADMWYRASRLRPEQMVTWENARRLYERYLELSKGQEADDQIDDAQGRLGRIYFRLAQQEEDAARRAALVKDALDRLEATMAKVPENLPLLVGHLKGDYAVVSWAWRRGDGRTYRFALPRVKTVAELKQAVNNLGKPNGTPIPRYSKEEDNQRFQQALKAFQEFVNLERDAALEQTVRSFARPGFDIIYFATYGKARREFRLALAWVYSESGGVEDALKAANLAASLTDGPAAFAAEEDSEEWWEAQVLRLRAYLRGAEALLKATPGSPSPQAVEWVNMATNALRVLNVRFPRLGREERPDTPKEIAQVLARLQVLRQQAGLQPLNIVLGRIAAEDAVDAARDGAGGGAPPDGPGGPR